MRVVDTDDIKVSTLCSFSASSIARGSIKKRRSRFRGLLFRLGDQYFASSIFEVTAQHRAAAPQKGSFSMGFHVGLAAAST